MYSRTKRPDDSRAARVTGGLAITLTLLSLAATAVGMTRAEPNQQDALMGAGVFRAYCASCHGTSAEGDGEIARYLKVTPADLTRIAEREGGDFPYEQVVKIIDGRQGVKGHGRGEMPVWGDAFAVTSGGRSEEQIQEKIRQLAHYLWSIQK